MGVSPVEMRQFALDCLHWSDQTTDAAQRDLMIRIAKSWMNVASSLERRVEDGYTLVPDLRRKLD